MNTTGRTCAPCVASGSSEEAARVLSDMERSPARLLRAVSLLSMESSFTSGCPEPTPSQAQALCQLLELLLVEAQHLQESYNMFTSSMGKHSYRSSGIWSRYLTVNSGQLGPMGLANLL